MKRTILLSMAVSLLVCPALSIPNYTITDLGTLGGNLSSALGLNNRGQIVGHSNIAGNSVVHAFLYEDGVMTDLGISSDINSWAWAINDSGVVSGTDQQIIPNIFPPDRWLCVFLPRWCGNKSWHIRRHRFLEQGHQ